MRRLLIAACLLVAVVAGFALWATLRRAALRPLQDAVLTFVGLTNALAGNFATFRLTNGTRAHIACVPEAIEQASAEAWRRTSLMGKGSSALLKWVGLRNELKPGQAFTFMVPAPGSNGTWRRVFLCQEEVQLLDPAADLARQVTDSKARQNNLHQFSGRQYHPISEEVVRAP